ncbi:MAG: PIN domain-containing protein, partial [Opitutaceae bacterium]
MKPVYVVDANVVTRMLRGDHPQHSPQAKELFKRAERGEFILEITDVTAAEIVWVLTSFYEVARQDIANSLLKLLGNPGVVASNASWLMAALESFRDSNVDATDCFIAAFAKGQ